MQYASAMRRRIIRNDHEVATPPGSRYAQCQMAARTTYAARGKKHPVYAYPPSCVGTTKGAAACAGLRMSGAWLGEK